ncbi:MAG: hypothetical protein ACJ707_00970 [Nitrososphaera sp.]
MSVQEEMSGYTWGPFLQRFVILGGPEGLGGKTLENGLDVNQLHEMKNLVAPIFTGLY